MPQGTGTYGSKVGRPPKKNKKRTRSGAGMASYQSLTGSGSRRRKKSKS